MILPFDIYSADHWLRFSEYIAEKSDSVSRMILGMVVDIDFSCGDIDMTIIVRRASCTITFKSGDSTYEIQLTYNESHSHIWDDDHTEKTKDVYRFCVGKTTGKKQLGIKNIVRVKNVHTDSTVTLSDPEAISDLIVKLALFL